MTPMTDENEDVPSPAMPRWVKWAAISTLAAGVVVYVLIAAVGNEAKWGPRGDAVGPFAALFNAGALFAALWAVHLQRTELALQRQELRETRKEMVEQREQLRRAAEAQGRLATAQAASAQAQLIANKLAVERARRVLSSDHAHRAGNVATLMAAEANLVAVVTSAKIGAGMLHEEQKVLNVLQDLSKQRARERELLAGLEETLANIDREREEEEREEAEREARAAKEKADGK
jgi:hypothetical protein